MGGRDGDGRGGVGPGGGRLGTGRSGGRRTERPDPPGPGGLVGPAAEGGTGRVAPSLLVLSLGTTPPPLLLLRGLGV